MRALWIFSAPVVAGGLAWAVNAASDSGPLLAGAPQAPNGKIIHFSPRRKPPPPPPQAKNGKIISSRRGGNPAAAPSDADVARSDADAESADDSAADDAADAEAPVAPSRFVRNRPAAGAATVANAAADSGSSASGSTKNYKNLFAEEDSSVRQTAARRAAKPANASAKPVKKPIIEEC